MTTDERRSACARAQYRAQLRTHPCPLVPTQPIIQHIRRRLRGLGFRQVARLAGVHCDTVRRILKGRARHIRQATARRITAIRAKRRAPGADVSSWRTRQLLKAIAAEGWTREDICRMTGRSQSALRCDQPRVKVATAEAVEDLYRRLMSEDATVLEGLPVRDNL